MELYLISKAFQLVFHVACGLLTLDNEDSNVCLGRRIAKKKRSKISIYIRLEISDHVEAFFHIIANVKYSRGVIERE